MQVIVYQNPENGIAAIAHPTPEYLASGRSVETLAARVVPHGVPFSILETSELPADPTFRDAWMHQDSGIEVNMPAAREIHREHIRQARKPLLEQLDIEVVRAMEQGHDPAPAAQKKQRLRDAPAHPAIEAAATPEELKAAWNHELLGASPYAT